MLEGQNLSFTSTVNKSDSPKMNPVNSAHSKELRSDKECIKIYLFIFFVRCKHGNHQTSYKNRNKTDNKRLKTCKNIIRYQAFNREKAAIQALLLIFIGRKNI